MYLVSPVCDTYVHDTLLALVSPKRLVLLRTNTEQSNHVVLVSAPVAYVEVDDVESFQIGKSQLAETPRATYSKVTRYRSLVLEIYDSTTHAVSYVHSRINSFTAHPSMDSLLHLEAVRHQMTAISWHLSVTVREVRRSSYHQLQTLSIVQLGGGSRSW